MNRKKFALAALLLALCFALTGCNLIQTNQVAILEDELHEAEKTMSGVLATYDGGEVTQFDVTYDYLNQYNYYYQLYQQYAAYGLTMTSDIVDELRRGVVEQAVQDAAIAREFEVRGLALEETEEEIRAESDETWSAYYQQVLSTADGATDEEKAMQATLTLYQNGLTEEALFEKALVAHKQTVVEAAVRDEIETVSDEEIQAIYDEKLATDQETYTASPELYGQNVNGDDAIYYVPEGYRTVKHILVKPEDSVLDAMNDARDALDEARGNLETLNIELTDATAAPAADEPAQDAETAETAEASETETEATDDSETLFEDDQEAQEAPMRTPEEIQADIDALNATLPELESAVQEAEQAVLDAVSEKTDAIYAALAEGQSFDDLMAEYGEDPGMQSEPAKTTGYYVCAQSSNWVDEFRDGAMALEKVGDYSPAPVVSTFGAHIIYYNSDVTAGPVSLDDVRDDLYAEELESQRAAHYAEALAGWIEALNPVYTMENWSID